MACGNPCTNTCGNNGFLNSYCFIHFISNNTWLSYMLKDSEINLFLYETNNWYSRKMPK